jgi:S-adenosylmethionine hydrolase
VRAGETLALFGSSDRLEIAVNLGRACERVGIDSEEIVGTEVEVRRL